MCGEADEVSLTTIQAWIERFPELCQDYEPQNILNIDGLGLFFKALPEKSLAEKTKKSKGRKKLKQSMTVMFIVASDGSFVLNQLSFGDQNYHVVLSPLKMHQDQCLCITFRTKKLGWTRTLWRVFCRDWTKE